jgi:para-nitrobenzyl esterase
MPTGSEDCLSLNVWTPSLAPAPQAQRPVMVFVYGGGNVIGATNQQLLGGNLYDGTALANAQDVVVITFNYRLGALGFLAHPSLSEASRDKRSGNYGLFDALLALRWVQANAANFGGDAQRVMLFGESAGAFNTCALVGSPLAKGLFSAALMESGNCSAPLMTDRYAAAGDFAKRVQCDGVPDVVSCLKSAPLDQVVVNSGSLYDLIPGDNPTDPKTIGDLPFGASVDGYLLPASPLDALRKGMHNHIPLVLGSNMDEFAVFSVVPNAVPTTCQAYQDRLKANFGPLADQVFAHYPCSILDPVSGHDAYIKAISAALFTCPSRRAVAAAAGSQAEPVYRFLFTHHYDYGALLPLGAFHTAELEFVFNSFNALSYLPTPGESALSARIQSRWSGLARASLPDGPAGISWPQYNPALDNALALDTNDSVVNGFDAEGCDFWDSVQ